MLLSTKLNNYYGIVSHGVVIKLLLNRLCNRLYSDFLAFLIRKCINQSTKYPRGTFLRRLKVFLIPFIMLPLMSPTPSLQCFIMFVFQVVEVLML